MRLDVAVDDAGGVGGVEGVGDLGEEVDHPLRRQRSLLVDQPAQVPARDQPHHHQQLAVDLARVVDRHHRRVLEASGEAGLAQEALAEAAAVGELAGDHLQRHRPVEADVGSAVDDAHATARDQLFDPVAGDLVTNGKVPHPAVIAG